MIIFFCSLVPFGKNKHGGLWGRTVDFLSYQLFLNFVQPSFTGEVAKAFDLFEPGLDARVGSG